MRSDPCAAILRGGHDARRTFIRADCREGNRGGRGERGAGHWDQCGPLSGDGIRSCVQVGADSVLVGVRSGVRRHRAREELAAAVGKRHERVEVEELALPPVERAPVPQVAEVIGVFPAGGDEAPVRHFGDWGGGEREPRLGLISGATDARSRTIIARPGART